MGRCSSLRPPGHRLPRPAEHRRYAARHPVRAHCDPSRGPIAERPWNWRLFAGTGTDYRKPVTAFVGAYGQWGEGGSRIRQLFSEFAVKPSPTWNMSFVRSLRGNAVVRWEWRPGATLYVAWQQIRSDFENIGDFNFRRDQTALWSARPDNVFVVKLNYWLNP